jgi:RNA polymerase sigma factor (TIGR02999 family)
MANITQILSQIEAGDPVAAEQLLPLMYAELRKLAAARLAQEKPGQTLQATALVHEAYLRLVGNVGAVSFANRGHFFAAAAEAMRRILIESARRRAALKRGCGWERVELAEVAAPVDVEQLDLLALDTALTQFAAAFPEKAQLVKLRYFAGCTLEEAADYLGISRATATRSWTFARAWLYGKLK